MSSLLSKTKAIDKETLGENNYIVKMLKESDCENISSVYETVFESYPFPIHDPDYILQTMKNAVRYFGIEHEGKLRV
ncbi:MAG: hypothetical protein ACK5HT_18680 [Draconibacterium sp.]